MDDEERERRYQAADWRHRPRYEKQIGPPAADHGRDTAPTVTHLPPLFHEVMGEVIAHERHWAREDRKADYLRFKRLRDELQVVRAELRETKLEVARLINLLSTMREERAERGTGPLDLPRIPMRSGTLN